MVIKDKSISLSVFRKEFREVKFGTSSGGSWCPPRHSVRDPCPVPDPRASPMWLPEPHLVRPVAEFLLMEDPADFPLTDEDRQTSARACARCLLYRNEEELPVLDHPGMQELAQMRRGTLLFNGIAMIEGRSLSGVLATLSPAQRRLGETLGTPRSVTRTPLNGA